MLFKRVYIYKYFVFLKLGLKIVAAAAIVRVLYEVKYLSHIALYITFMKIENIYFILKYIHFR